jgi:hypothetical protein
LKRAIEDADGIKVTEQLTLELETVLSYSAEHKVVTRVLRSGTEK